MDERVPHDLPDQPSISFDSAVIGMAITLPDGRFARVNSALCRMLGYSREELEGKSFGDLTHPEDQATSATGLADMVAGTSDMFHQRKRYVTSDGHPVWADLHVAAVRDAQGALRYVVAQMLNINAQVAVESALREQVADYTDIIDHAADLVVELDLAGRILWISPSCERWIGREPSAVRGSDGFALLQMDLAEPLTQSVVQEVMAGRVVDDVPLRLRSDGGEGLPVRARLTRMPGPVDSVLVTVRVAEREQVAPAASETVASDVGKTGFWLRDTVRQALSALLAATGGHRGEVEITDKTGEVLDTIQVQAGAQESMDTAGPQARAAGDGLVKMPLALGGTTLGYLYLDRPDRSITNTDNAIAGLMALAIRTAQRLEVVQRLGRVSDAASSLQAAALDSGSDEMLLAKCCRDLIGLLSCQQALVIDFERTEVAAQAGHAPAWQESQWVADGSLRGVVASADGTIGTGPLGSGALSAVRGPWALAAVGSPRHARYAALCLRNADDADFDDSDLEALETMCARLYVALTFADMRRTHEQEALREDRLRVARDLHDLTIQRIFATGLLLESQLRRPEISAEVVRVAIDELNAAIVELRQHITGLHGPGSAVSGWDIEAAVLREVGRAGLGDGLDVGVSVDVTRTDHFSAQVLAAVVAVVREGLSNAVVHGGPGKIHVAVRRDEEFLQVAITDAGRCDRHTPDPGHGRGLANLLQRARNLGGGMDLNIEPGGPTVLRWWIRYPEADPRPADA